MKFFRNIIQKIFNLLGYKISPISEYPDKLVAEFKNTYEKCKDFTMTSVERMYALHEAVKYTIKNNIQGDFVECGVWKGGSSMMIALTLLELGIKNRKIYLYDTFEGMPKPTEEDGKANKKWREKWCRASLEEVKKNMASTGYPEENLIFIKGKVEETIPKKIPGKIALLRLDTDWYESTNTRTASPLPFTGKERCIDHKSQTPILELRA